MLRSRGGSRQPLQASSYLFKNRICILEHPLILESNHRHVKTLQKLRSFCVGFRPELRHVPRAIQLNSQPTFRTKKVDNVRTYAVLSSELLSVELRILQMFPEKSFGRSKTFAEFFASVIRGCQVMDQTAAFHAENLMHETFHQGTTPSAPS